MGDAVQLVDEEGDRHSGDARVRRPIVDVDVQAPILDGAQLAANVADYTFASSGIYIVKVGGKSVKLTVK